MHHVPHTEHMDGSIGRNGEAQSALDKEVRGNILWGSWGMLSQKNFLVYMWTSEAPILTSLLGLCRAAQIDENCDNITCKLSENNHEKVLCVWSGREDGYGLDKYIYTCIMHLRTIIIPMLCVFYICSDGSDFCGLATGFQVGC